MDKVNRLKVQNLSKKYGNVLALNNVSFDLEPGIYALLGHNGAGKTTLLNILATVIESDSGSIFFNDEVIEESRQSFRSILGYMPQQQQLLPYLSIESFLYYLASMKDINHKQAKGVIESVLKEVHLYEIRNRSLSTLSGGMKQRVLIAQALLNNPKVLLLDEPTAGLDPVERRSFRELIARISEHKIVILATHVISDVEWIANEIMIMRNGQILTISTQADLLEKTKVFESFDNLDKLIEVDSNMKVVNQIRIRNSIKTRFISRHPFDNQVSTSLDDVYLDWLG
ncbi:MAG: ATP-binding cassette domain-containing protein [Erysipelotrichaceae bacterium]